MADCFEESAIRDVRSAICDLQDAAAGFFKSQIEDRRSKI